MRLDPKTCRQLLENASPLQVFGKVHKVVGLVAEGSGLRSPLGAVCHMLAEATDLSQPQQQGIAAEVCPMVICVAFALVV